MASAPLFSATGQPAVSLPLVMELGVTPALWLWQQRVARDRRGGLRG